MLPPSRPPPGVTARPWGCSHLPALLYRDVAPAGAQTLHQGGGGPGCRRRGPGLEDRPLPVPGGPGLASRDSHGWCIAVGAHCRGRSCKRSVLRPKPCGVTEQREAVPAAQRPSGGQRSGQALRRPLRAWGQGDRPQGGGGEAVWATEPRRPAGSSPRGRPPRTVEMRKPLPKVAEAQGALHTVICKDSLERFSKTGEKSQIPGLDRHQRGLAVRWKFIC